DRVVAGQQDIDPHDLEQSHPKRGLAHLAPAARDHAEPPGRLHHFCDRTHSMSLSLSRARADRLDGPLPTPNQSTGETRGLASALKRHAPQQPPPSPHPTMSLPEKNCAISCCAVSGASEPCTEFSPTDSA